MRTYKVHLKELRKATADEAIMSVIERKRRLSQIARARYDDPDRAGDPIAAIHQLNLMDGVYRNKSEVSNPGGSSSTVVVVKEVPPLKEGKQKEASG